MTVRVAKFGDIPRIVEILIESHENSVYSDISSVNVRATKALLVNALQRNGQKTDGGFLVLVAETKGRVEGFIMGGLQPIYLILDKLQVSDVFWISTKKAEYRDSVKLLDMLLKWARSCPDVADEQFSVNGSIKQNWQRAGKVLERRGFRLHGHIYRKDSGK